MLVTRLGQVQLGEDRVHVLLDRALGDPEAARDPAVREAFGHQAEHLALTRRERLERVVATASRHELANKSRINDRTAVQDALA